MCVCFVILRLNKWCVNFSIYNMNRRRENGSHVSHYIETHCYYLLSHISIAHSRMHMQPIVKLQIETCVSERARACVCMFCLIISSEICVTVPRGKWKWHTVDTMGLFWLNEIKVRSKWMKLKVFFVIRWKRKDITTLNEPKLATCSESNETCSFVRHHCHCYNVDFM